MPRAPPLGRLPETVRRSRLAVLLLVAAIAAGAVSACGAGEPVSGTPAAPTAAAGEAPAPRDLAADALAALERARSAHYALDATLQVDSADGGAGLAGGPVSLHVEGDADDEAVTADVTLEAAAQRFAARLLARPHELYVQFMGAWYGGELPDAGSGIDAELATPERVRRHFEEIFVGEVSPGPLVDGQATWSYEGTLDPDGLRTLARHSGEALSKDELRQLEELAHAAALRFLVGREDSLPRRIELDVDLDLTRLEGSGPALTGADAIHATVVLRLSDFGKRVEFAPPKRFQPLEELVRTFLGGAV